jgi:hypothetical protein
MLRLYKNVPHIKNLTYHDVRYIFKLSIKADTKLFMLLIKLYTDARNVVTLYRDQEYILRVSEFEFDDYIECYTKELIPFYEKITIIIKSQLQQYPQLTSRLQCCSYKKDYINYYSYIPILSYDQCQKVINTVDILFYFVIINQFDIKHSKKSDESHIFDIINDIKIYIKQCYFRNQNFKDIKFVI